MSEHQYLAVFPGERLGAGYGLNLPGVPILAETFVAHSGAGHSPRCMVMPFEYPSRDVFVDDP